MHTHVDAYTHSKQTSECKMLICPLTVVPVIVTTGCSVSVSSRWERSLEETLHL